MRYVFQKNAGLPAARNTGIRAARHPLVCFLDADDVLLPGLLRQAAETLNRLPEAFALVAFHFQFMDGEGNPLPVKTLPPGQGEEISGHDIILKTRFGTTGLVAKREVFGECGYFDETLRSSEDRDMWIRIASRRRIFLHGESLVQLRRHTISMSRNSARMKENIRRMLDKAYQDRRVPRGNVFFWLSAYSFLNFQSAWMYFDEGRRGRAIRDLLHSLLLWPWFPHPDRLNEPPLFRLRGLLRFLLNKRG